MSVLSSKFEVDLQVLANLKQGWDGDDAIPIDESVLRIAHKAIIILCSFNIPEPELGAVEDGRLDIFWETIDLFCTLDKNKLRIHPLHNEEMKDIPLTESNEDELVKSLVEILYTLTRFSH
jgi:hypothetical protein